MEVWTNHVTDEMPVARHVWVDVMRFDGTVDYALPAAGWNWNRNLLCGQASMSPSNHGIAAYRVCSYQPEEN